MIDYLNGTLESKEINSIVIDVNGIGYKVAVPVSTFEKLPTSESFSKIIYSRSCSRNVRRRDLSLWIITRERDMYLLIDKFPEQAQKQWNIPTKYRNHLLILKLGYD